MKSAYTGWMWLRPYEGRPEEFRARFEQCVLELSYLGYDCLENFTFLKGYLTPQQVRETCARHGTSMSALYANLADGLDTLRRDVDYAAAIGAGYLICSSPNWPPEQGLDSPPDWDEVRREAALCCELGEYANAAGVRLLHNHHSFTPVCRRPEIDLFLSLTPAELVGICADNGHALVAGMDAMRFVRDYGSRVEYVHVKDLDPTRENRGRGMSWVPLGLGTANLPGFFEALRDIGFDGVVCAGLPLGCERINRFESARLSRIYLKSMIGV